MRRASAALLALLLLFTLCACGNPAAVLYDNLLADMDYEGRCNELLYDLEHGQAGFVDYGVIQTMLVELENYQGDERVMEINEKNKDCLGEMLLAHEANGAGETETALAHCAAARELYKKGYRALQRYKNELEKEN